MTNIGLLALAAIVLSHGPADVAAQASLVPTGKWVMSGENGRCVLSRDYAAGGEPVTLVIEPFPLQDDIDLIIKTRQRTGRVIGRWTRIGFGSAVAKTRLFSFDSSDGTHRIHRLEVARKELDRAAQGETLLFKGLDDADLSVPITGIEKAIEVLRQCEQVIIENVGLSREEVQAIERYPEAPMILVRTGQDYFELSAKGDLEDVAISRYIVDANGNAGNCGIVHLAKNEWLNRRACRGWPEKFQPATDKSGKKVRGLFFERVRWKRREEWKGL